MFRDILIDLLVCDLVGVGHLIRMQTGEELGLLQFDLQIGLVYKLTR